MRNLTFIFTFIFLYLNSNTIETLIITRDKKIPYKLCVSVQQVDKNTIFAFIPKDGKGDIKVVSTSRNKTFFVQQERFFDFINLIYPKRIILLGNESLVPYNLVKGIRKAKMYHGPLSIYLVDDDNWFVNAWELAEIYQEDYIGDLFQKVNLSELRRFELISKRKSIAPARNRHIILKE